MRHSRGFTLVELLVVVAIIALLVSILLPSLETARAQAQGVSCRARLHDIYSAMRIYGNLYEDWLPGSPGTSGKELEELDGKFGSLADDTPGIPVQNWDWQSPLAYHSLKYSNIEDMHERSERWEKVRNLEIFRCPSNNYQAVPYTGELGPGPWAQHPEWPVLTMNSFSTIRAFMFFGTQPDIADDGIHQPSHSHWSRKTPEGHVPRMTNIQRPSDKVFMVDGSRYITTTGIDFDVGFRASMGGSFSTAGPSSSYSNAFVNPVEMSHFDDAAKDRYAYRHPVGSEPGLSSLFFDGHVGGMKKHEAIVGLDYWYPTGTLVKESEYTGQHPKPRAQHVIMERDPDPNDSQYYPIY